MPPAVLHPDDDRAEAGPGVEPGVEHDELLGAAVYAHRGERGEHFVPISARISPGDQPRRPVGDDEQRVGLTLDAMGRRLRSPRLPGVDVPAPSAPARDAMGRRAIAGGASGVTMARAGPHPRRARHSGCPPESLPSGAG